MSKFHNFIVTISPRICKSKPWSESSQTESLKHVSMSTIPVQVKKYSYSLARHDTCMPES